MFKIVFFIIFAIPFIRWALAIQYPNLLKRYEGNRAIKALEKEWGRARDDGRTRSIALRLMNAGGLTSVIKVLPGDPVNAVALPNARIFLWQGMVDRTKDDDEMLAGVIAHEMGHLKHDHFLKRIHRLSALNFALGFLGSLRMNSTVRNIVEKMIASGFSREQEEEADAMAVGYMLKAGFDPEGLARLFEILAKTSPASGLLGSHPDPESRARRVRLLHQKMINS